MYKHNNSAHFLSLLTLIVILFISKGLQAYSLVDPNTPRNALPTPTELGENWTLDFSDEFSAGPVNQQKWNIDNSKKSRAARPNLRIWKWFWRPNNVWIENDNLVLRVNKQDGSTLTCGSINSNNKYETAYGYMEARIKIADAAKASHTAFWLQGDNQSKIDGTALDGAEIDIFESAWLGDYTKSVIHIDGYGAAHKANTRQYSTPGIHEGYHVFGLHWTPEFLKIYYDGKLKVTYQNHWVPQVPEYLWLSCGASFGIAGDYFTREPKGELSRAYVDYVRVWKPNLKPSVKIKGPSERTFIKGDEIIIEASASDPDGEIEKLEFMRWAKVVSTQTQAPFKLNQSNLWKGKHIFRARVTDNQGATVTSETITVYVTDPPPEPIEPPVLIVDECNTTSECKDLYGISATDCKNSKSDSSICACGAEACNGFIIETTPIPTPPPTPTPSQKTTPTQKATIPNFEPGVDECDTTTQCKIKYGDSASDCAKSKSEQSICACGDIACSEL